MDSTPAVDLKAAMKAAASNGVQQSEQSHSSTSVEGGVGEINGSLTPEEAAAISILEPLLAPDERAKYESELNRYFTPAQRWRIRRVG